MTSTEKHAFFIHKLERCIEILAILAAYSGLQTLYISKLLKMNSIKGVVGQNDVIEYMVYERIEKINPWSQATFKLLSMLDQGFEKNLEGEFNMQKTNVLDFRELESLVYNLKYGKKKFLQASKNDFSSFFDQIITEIEHSQSIIKSFSSSPTPPKDGIFINFPKIESLLSQVPLEQQQTELPDKLQIITQDAHLHFKDLQESQKFLSDRFNALNICMHLKSFNNKTSSIQLHKKLNAIIHPIWNQIRMEQEEFYQKVFSRILS